MKFLIIIFTLIRFGFPCIPDANAQTGNKFGKWMSPSFFRGYNVLYESPHGLRDFIDFKNYGGNYFEISTWGFLSEDNPYSVVQKNIDSTDRLVGYCRQAGIYYTIAVRSGPGAYDTYQESQGNTPESRIWNTGNIVEQQLYADMLMSIAQRYSNDSLFVGMILVVEPRPKVKLIPANYSALYKRFLETVYNIHMDQVYQLMVDRIRTVDAELPLMIENFAYSTPELFPAYEVNDPYIVYSAHDYMPKEFTGGNPPYSKTYPGVYWNITYVSQVLYNRQFIGETVFGTLKAFQAQTGKPVLMAELGMLYPQTGSKDYLKDVLELSIENGWHFALWDWRRGPGMEWNIENFPSDTNIDTRSDWEEVLSHLHAPPVPVLLSPLDGSGDQTQNPTFVWDSLTSYTKYDLAIMDEFSTVVQVENINTAHYTYAGNLLRKGFSYRWGVRSKNPGGTPSNFSEWSSPWSFYIPSPDGPLNVKKIDYEIEGNLPNPFNPATRICFSIAERSYVTLAVYDLLGREIRMLADGLMAPGRHSVNFDASNLSSGIYFYRLTAQPGSGGAVFTEVRKMMLLK